MIVETHQHQPATHHWTVSPMSLLYHWRQLLSTTSETNPLEYLPEEWQALGRKFAFTYTTSFT